MLDAAQPELMFRAPGTLDLARDGRRLRLRRRRAVRERAAARARRRSRSLVLDADALNAIAADAAAASAAAGARTARPATVLTPHPLEAARLLAPTQPQVQADRLAAARELADRFGAVVVLKGSGTVIAAPGETPVINPTGNARLATAGTGDVLAGMIGAALAAGRPAFAAAAGAVYAAWHSRPTLARPAAPAAFAAPAAGGLAPRRLEPA